MRVIAACLLLTLTACTETQKRNIKTTFSEYTGGLDRECTVYSQTGKELRRYKGRYDIEKSNGRIQMDIDGKRKMIYNALTICEEL